MSDAKPACLCGKPVYRAGQCATCYRHGDRFDGHRGEVIARDDRRCVACEEEPEHPCVHHRKPEESTIEKMATICTKCHARVHRTKKQNRFMTPVQQQFWAELHQPDALQLQFDLPEAFSLDSDHLLPLVEFTPPDTPPPVAALPEYRQLTLEEPHDSANSRAVSASV